MLQIGLPPSIDETDIIGRNSCTLQIRHSRKNDQIGYYADLEKLGAYLSQNGHNGVRLKNPIHCN